MEELQLEGINADCWQEKRNRCPDRVAFCTKWPLRWCQLARVGNLSRRHRPDLIRFQRHDRRRVTVQCYELHLVGLPIPVYVHNGTHVAALEPMLRNVLRQHNSVM